MIHIMDITRSTLVLLAVLAISPEASACRCDTGTIDSNFRNSESVFRIRVTRTELRRTLEINFADLAATEDVTEDDIAEFVDDRPEVIEVSFEVIEIFKGSSVIPHQLYEKLFEPGNCALGLTTGIEYVIFRSGSYFKFASFCSGSFGFFNAEGTKIKNDLDRLRKLAKQ